jgi:DnaJ-class molecular chaperone
MNNSQAFATLGLPEDTTPAQVRARWRELAATGLHPDHGGLIDRWLDLQSAYQRALQLAKQPILCTACQGRGKLPDRKGRSFQVTWLTCGKCGGTGKTTQNCP